MQHLLPQHFAREPPTLLAARTYIQKGGGEANLTTYCSEGTVRGGGVSEGGGGGSRSEAPNSVVAGLPRGVRRAHPGRGRGGGSNGGKGEEREFRPSEALFVRRGRRSVSRSHFWAAAAAAHRCERRKGAPPPPPPPPPPPAASLSLSFLVHETKAKKREDGRTEAAEGAERRKRRAPQISPP